MGFQLYCMKTLADLGLHKARFLESFHFFQESSNMLQCLLGKLGRRILVLDELQILAVFERCAWQYCLRLALKL